MRIRVMMMKKNLMPQPRSPVLAKLKAELNRIHDAWSLAALEAAANQFQYDLCDEFYHLDRIDPKTRYEVSTISVPIFVFKEVPVLCFVAGSFDKAITGTQIGEIAARMKASADRVARLASGRTSVG